jgi:hypothetical protein
MCGDMRGKVAWATRDFDNSQILEKYSLRHARLRAWMNVRVGYVRMKNESACAVHS